MEATLIEYLSSRPFITWFKHDETFTHVPCILVIITLCDFI